MTNIHPNQRLPYSAIVDRKPLKLPDNARVVIWPILALEVWDIIRPMARMIITPPQGSPLLPDFPNWQFPKNEERKLAITNCMLSFATLN